MALLRSSLLIAILLGLPLSARADAPSIDALLAKANIEAGKSAAKICATCHTFEKGQPAKIGPNLYGIVGSKHAHMEGFAYSPAMKAKAAEVWDVKALNNYIYDPKATVPGNKMAYPGLKKDEDRANVIAYLKSLSDKK
jgi:cytochrome c